MVDGFENVKKESYTYYVCVGELYGDVVQLVSFEQNLSREQLESLFFDVAMTLVYRNFEDIEEVAENNEINLNKIAGLKGNLFKVTSPKKYDIAMQSIADNKLAWEEFLSYVIEEVTVQPVMWLDPERNTICGME